jgi:hypothetical protein
MKWVQERYKQSATYSYDPEWVTHFTRLIAGTGRKAQDKDSLLSNIHQKVYIDKGNVNRERKPRLDDPERIHHPRPCPNQLYAYNIQPSMEKISMKPMLAHTYEPARWTREPIRGYSQSSMVQVSIRTDSSNHVMRFRGTNPCCVTSTTQADVPR